VRSLGRVTRANGQTNHTSLTAHATSKSFEAHQMIFHEGRPAKEWYLICQRKVRMETALLGCDGIRIDSLAGVCIVGFAMQ
jgi:hypothetical protein